MCKHNVSSTLKSTWSGQTGEMVITKHNLSYALSGGDEEERELNVHLFFIYFSFIVNATALYYCTYFEWAICLV